MKLELLSWNVNGIRAVEKKGFLDWLEKRKPDVLCLQETKAHPDQLSEALKGPKGYHTFWNQAERKGYSGVGVYSRRKPLTVLSGMEHKLFDAEGRVLTLEYPEFFLFNVYFPNGKSSRERLDFKMDFYREFYDYTEKFRNRKKPLIVCGDFNTAHQEIDLARPKENSTVSGFLPEERELLDLFAERGFSDTFRVFNKEPGNYSWWDFKTHARERNIGWRIDYFFLSSEHLKILTDAFIAPDIQGSDHCPVGINIKFYG